MSDLLEKEIMSVMDNTANKIFNRPCRDCGEPVQMPLGPELCVACEGKLFTRLRDAKPGEITFKVDYSVPNMGAK